MRVGWKSKIHREGDVEEILRISSEGGHWFEKRARLEVVFRIDYDGSA